MTFKGHYNQFFNCLTCNKRTDIMLDNCTHCGSRTPVDQKDYRRMRTRKLNAISISKGRKIIERLDDLIKGSKVHSKTVSLYTVESNIAKNLGQIQKKIQKIC